MSKVRVLAPEIERKALPHRPKALPNSGGSWIIETGGGGGGGGPVTIPTAPPVKTPLAPAEIFFRDNHQVEIDLAWTEANNATVANFAGVAVYLEDPDISSGPNIPLDGTRVLDGTAQLSAQWAPVFVNNSTAPSGKRTGTAVLFLDTTMGSVAGGTFRKPRNVRIYLASYGPNTQANVIRATQPNATPNIMVEVAAAPIQYQSAMEWAFLCSNPNVTVTTDYNRPDPNYYLTFFYTPPDSSIPLPKGVNAFGGCRIVFVSEDVNGMPQFPGTDSGISVPVAQSESGYKSPVYTASTSGGNFRAYFCSEDDAQPLGLHVNSLVDGVTPYFEVVVPPVPAVPIAPDVTGFTINGGASLDLAHTKFVWQLNGSFFAQATLAWNLPTSDGAHLYSGVFLYLVNVTGTVHPLTPFPQLLTGQQSSVDKGYSLEVSNIPANDETWTIAAISVSGDGALSDNPADIKHAPTVTWTLGPPPPGSVGQEHAPPVTINAGAAATPTESTSVDGVRMVSFAVGNWTDPASSQFGGAQVAMVLNHDPTKPVYWPVPGNATSFTTPPVPSFGTVGTPVPVDFYIVSDDPQGNKNSIVPGTTPRISVAGAGYTPTAGAVIPARSGWFDPSQFAWDTSGQFQGQAFSASIIQVGSKLIVGGSPSASFGGQQAGQIAVEDKNGNLLGWIGQQNAGNQTTPGLQGAWFKQLWVGGTNPLDAPLFVDTNGIIEVGGIAAAQGSNHYPYISARNSSGVEVGRIGAQINSTQDAGGNTGSSPPPQLTDGAWFTQLAAGGSNLMNWNMLLIPHQTTPPTFAATGTGSDFYLRNVYLFSIDYPANSSPAGSNPEYKIDFGNSVWMAAGLNGGFKFPGIHVYEIDGSGNNFGATFINRGMVLRSNSSGYPVIASMVMYNGDAGGGDGTPFWGQLTMYSPGAGNPQTVLLASGGSTSTSGGLTLQDVNGNVIFRAGIDGSIWCKYGQVIDPTGHWTGVAIGGGGSAAGGNLSIQYSNGSGGFMGSTNATVDASGNIGANGRMNAVGGFEVAGSLVIDGTADAHPYTFVGSGGVNTSGGVTCGAVNCSSLSVSGSMSFASLSISGSLTMTGASQLFVQTNAGGTQINCAQNGIWIGSGVQCGSAVYGSEFGINGVARGYPLQNQTPGSSGASAIPLGNGHTIYVLNGIIVGYA